MQQLAVGDVEVGQIEEGYIGSWCSIPGGAARALIHFIFAVILPLMN